MIVDYIIKIILNLLVKPQTHQLWASTSLTIIDRLLSVRGLRISLSYTFANEEYFCEFKFRKQIAFDIFWQVQKIEKSCHIAFLSNLSSKQSWDDLEVLTVRFPSDLMFEERLHLYKGFINRMLNGHAYLS